MLISRTDLLAIVAVIDLATMGKSGRYEQAMLGRGMVCRNAILNQCCAPWPRMDF